MTLVLGTVRPLLFTLPVLLVVDPVALVLGAIGVRVLAEAVRLVVDPMSIVNVAVGVDQSSATVSLVSLPVALVDASVRPNLIAFAVLLVRLHVPFALISCTIGQRHHGSVFLDHVRLILLVLRQAVLEFGQAIADVHDSGALLLQLLGVHLNMHRVTPHETLCHLKIEAFFDGASGQISAHHSLHLDNHV